MKSKQKVQFSLEYVIHGTSSLPQRGGCIVREIASVPPGNADASEPGTEHLPSKSHRRPQVPSPSRLSPSSDHAAPDQRESPAKSNASAERAAAPSHPAEHLRPPASSRPGSSEHPQLQPGQPPLSFPPLEPLKRLGRGVSVRSTRNKNNDSTCSCALIFSPPHPSDM